MRLIITRHGETEDNKARILTGHLPGKLSKEGILQAKKLALRLKDEKIDYVYSSDLKRCVDTTNAILNYHPDDVKVEFTSELRERYMADFEGKKRDDLGPDYFQKMNESKDVESLENMRLRAEKFLHQVLKKHKTDTVLFVAHNWIKKSLIGVITGKEISEVLKMETMHNTSVSIFEISKDKNHKIHAFNCAKHLD